MGPQSRHECVPRLHRCVANLYTASGTGLHSSGKRNTGRLFGGCRRRFRATNNNDKPVVSSCFHPNGLRAVERELGTEDHVGRQLLCDLSKHFGHPFWIYQTTRLIIGSFFENSATADELLRLPNRTVGYRARCRYRCQTLYSALPSTGPLLCKTIRSEI